MARIDPSAVWDFAGEIVGRIVPSRATTTATVTRVDPDGTTWVTTGDGGEAPATSVAAGVSVGDTVTLEWDGSAMGIRSNVSDPAPPGSSIRRAVDRARGVASAAQKVADAVNQHFFADDNGIHVTEATQDEWGASHSGANVLINSVGQLFRDGLNNLLTLTTEGNARALTVWDGLGNTASNIRAIIGEIIQLGKTGESHAVIDYHSLQLVDRNGTTYFHVSDLRDATGYATITDSFVGDGSTTAFLLSLVPKSIQSVTVDGVAVEYAVSVMTVTLATAAPDGASVNVSYTTFSSSAKAYTLGVRKAGSNIGALSVAEGYGTTASGSNSHAENYDTTASGHQSHAEGYSSTASGYQSHAEGYDTTASGSNSHAEGRKTTASEYASHAEGLMSVASGSASHAQNLGTVAAHDGQTAIGRYNDNKPNNALEVGNGTDDRNRSNAFAVDWDGVVWSADDVPWTVLPLNSEFEAYNERTVPHYCKRGGVVTVMGAVKPTAELAAQANVDIATLPEGCRPKVISYTTGHGSNARLWLCTVYENGVVRFGRHANGASWVSADTSAFLGFCVTYVAGD